MILVTGATGHVGNVLTRTLVADGASVRALVLPGDRAKALQDLDVELVEGDVLDLESLERAMEGIDLVYHLAGIIAIMPGIEHLMRRVNVDGVRNVATAAGAAGVRRMVYVSSIHAFRRMPDDVIVDEETPLAVANAAGTYDRTKAEGTLAVREAVAAGLDAVTIHPTAIIGPYDYLGSELGRAILNFARRRLHLLVHGAYDFVDVRDIVDGLMLAAERGERGEAYILSGTYASILQLKRLVQQVAHIQTDHVVLPQRIALAFARIMQHVYRLTRTTPQFTPYSLETLSTNAHFSSAKARTALGFRTRALTETIVDLLAWHRAAQPA